MGNKTYKQYDERQKLVRGKVFTFAWIYTLCFFMVNAFIFEAGYQWCSNLNLAFLGVLISLEISYAILIIENAYTHIGKSKTIDLFGMFGIILLYIFGTTKDIKQYGFINDGKLTTGSCYLIVIPLFLLNMVLIIIDYKKDKKENKKSCKKV